MTILTRSNLLASLVAVLVTSGAASAQVVNGSFEAGTLSGWTLSGYGVVVGSSFGVAPTDGTRAALISTAGTTRASNLETFLGLPSGSLFKTSLTGGYGVPTAGSAIKQTITVEAGAQLAFDYDFFCNDALPNNDFAVFTVNGQVIAKLGDVAGCDGKLGGVPGFQDQVGWRTFAYSFPAKGKYTIGFAITDLRDNVVDSGLLVDNLRPCPFNPYAPATLGPASGHSVFVFGDYSGGQSVSMRIAAQGSVTMSGFDAGSGLAPGADAIVAGGALFLSAGTVEGNGWYGTGTSIDGSVSFTNNGTLLYGAPIDFAAARTQLLQLSSDLKRQAPNGQKTMDAAAALSLVGSDASLNVFAVSATELSSASSLSIAAPAGSTVVVNVSGQTQSFGNFSMWTTGVAPANVLFNFHEASAITISALSFAGSILAVNAEVRYTGGDAGGTIVAASLTSDVALHDAGFQGAVGKCSY